MAYDDNERKVAQGEKDKALHGQSQPIGCRQWFAKYRAAGHLDAFGDGNELASQPERNGQFIQWHDHAS